MAQGIRPGIELSLAELGRTEWNGMGWTEWHGFGRTRRNLVCMTGLGSCSGLLGHHASLDVGEDTRGTDTFMFVTNYVISLDPQE